jgi:hypothetical protein
LLERQTGRTRQSHGQRQSLFSAVAREITRCRRRWWRTEIIELGFALRRML